MFTRVSPQNHYILVYPSRWAENDALLPFGWEASLDQKGTDQEAAAKKVVSMSVTTSLGSTITATSRPLALSAKRDATNGSTLKQQVGVDTYRNS